MQIEIESEHIDITDALEQHVRDKLATIDRRWGERLTRIQMHLQDVNGPDKGGVDKHCVFEARVAGIDPVVAETTAADAYDAIGRAANKLARALEHAIESRRH